MNNDTEWGPWVAHNGGGCPEDIVGKCVFIQLNDETRDECNNQNMEFLKGVPSHEEWLETTAYRVKKDLVIEVVNANVSVYHDDGYTYRSIHLNATCTYRDGKLISINWESPDA